MGWHKVYIPEKKPRFCIKCRAKLSGDYPFCINCGTKRYKCSCGEFLDYGMQFCPKCGGTNHEAKKEQIKQGLAAIIAMTVFFAMVLITLFVLC